jgi:hypothetical protein
MSAQTKTYRARIKVDGGKAITLHIAAKSMSAAYRHAWAYLEIESLLGKAFSSLYVSIVAVIDGN